MPLPAFYIFAISPDLAEDQVWRNDVLPILAGLPYNVIDIWQYCFTEMLNNAIDHSGGTKVVVQVDRQETRTRIAVMDNGVGIFRKIQRSMGLIDERHAILELSKGKLTTDPEKHSGQGIFFTSRLLDAFDLLSGGVFFNHVFGEDEDWVTERAESEEGTTVFMQLRNETPRTCKDVFDQYSSGDDYGFTKTVVPVRLAQYGNDKLVSRSQAKRVLARVDLFKTVLFDFTGIDSIGQAFADEIFRVFAKSHPEIKLRALNTSADTARMIDSVASASLQPPDNLGS